MKKYTGAEADYTQAIKINPKSPGAYSNRGDLRYQLKNYLGAAADLTQVIEVNPEDAQAYVKRGVVYYLLKDYQSTIADWQIAVQLLRQQGETEKYQQVQQLLSELQALLK